MHIFAIDLASPTKDRAGQDIEEIQRLSTPFVRAAKGERRLRNVIILCSSNFATLNPFHRGNATRRLRRVDYILT